jgi:MSHA biogenesis protein MshN
MAAWLWSSSQRPQSESNPVTNQVVAAAISAVPDVLPEISTPPASKLSYELSAVPLPEALRKPIATQDQSKSQHASAGVPAVQPASKPSKPSVPIPAVVTAPPVTEIPLKQVSRTQQADAEFRKALALQQQGHVAEALAGYEAALKLNAQQDSARLAFAALLMESKRAADAERVLQEGLKIRPTQLVFSMSLARVQVERSQIDQALKTMQANLPQAEGRADYQAFYAALLQRQGRHKEAVNHYQIATQLAPNSGVWLMGLAISLQQVQRSEDAKATYQKALATQTLSPELTAFVEQKLKGF